MTGRVLDAGIAGLAVGLTSPLIHLVTFTVDSTGLNPARSLGTAIFADTDPARSPSSGRSSCSR